MAHDIIRITKESSNNVISIKIIADPVEKMPTEFFVEDHKEWNRRCRRTGTILLDPAVHGRGRRRHEAEAPV